MCCPSNWALNSNRNIYLVQLISNKMNKTCITCRDLRPYYGELHSGSCMALPTLGLPVVQSMEMFQHAGCDCDVQCATLDSNRKIYLVQLISKKMNKTWITYRDLRPYYGELHNKSCMALPTLILIWRQYLRSFSLGSYVLRRIGIMDWSFCQLRCSFRLRRIFPMTWEGCWFMFWLKTRSWEDWTWRMPTSVRVLCQNSLRIIQRFHWTSRKWLFSSLTPRFTSLTASISRQRTLIL